jgi:hypothetical protein
LVDVSIRQPDKNASGSGIYLSYHANLTAPFFFIRLVGANCVNPDKKAASNSGNMPQNGDG